MIEILKEMPAEAQLKLSLYLLVEIGKNIFNAEVISNHYLIKGAAEEQIRLISEAEELKSHIVNLFEQLSKIESMEGKE